MSKITDKILIGVFVVVIVAAAAIYTYTRFDDDGDDTENNGIAEVALTVSYGGGTWEYSIDDLRDMEAYCGSGGMSTRGGIRPPGNYTGVRFETLLQDIGVDDAAAIEANVAAVDGYSKTFEADALLGNVTVYDATGNETNGTVTLVVAYKENGEPIPADDGPLRLAFVSEQPLFTSSSYWIKQLTTIAVSDITS
jgi:hypothetical protein